jgi:hypothetical protein
MIMATPGQYAEIRELLLWQDPHKYVPENFDAFADAWKNWWEFPGEYRDADFITVLQESPYLRRS